MKLTSIELRQKKGELAKKMSELLDKALAENDKPEARAATMDEYKKLKSEFDGYDALIAASEEREKREAEAAGNTRKKDKDQRSPEVKAAAEFRLLPVLAELSKGKQPEGLARELVQEAEKEARASKIDFTGNFQLPSFIVSPNVNQEQRSRFDAERRAQTAGTATEGGNTVAVDIGGLVPILEPRLFAAEAGATYLRGLVGGLDLPRNSTDIDAAWEGENTQTGEVQLAFDKVQMRPKRLSAKVRISNQLLAQSSSDIENLVRERLNRAVQRKVDLATISGSGAANQPLGILNIPGVGLVIVGPNGGAPTWAQIVDLETKVADADADFGRLGYLTTAGIRGKLKTTEKASTTGMFIWSDTLIPSSSTRMGELNAQPAYVSSLVPKALTKGTSNDCHAIIYGNWSELVIGQWAGIDMLVNPYLEHDKAILNVSVNSWWDIGLLHDKSFAVIKDARIV